MSRTKLYGFREGRPDIKVEFGNSWGFCPMIWDSLVKKYGIFERELARYDKTMFDAWTELWRVVKEETVRPRPWELLVLRSTYDQALVKADRFEEYAKALEMFHEAHALPERVCHLASMSHHIKQMGPDVECVGFYGTSVNEDPWWVQGADDDEGRPYDLRVDTNHWFI
jgi:hypothetical protein